MKRIVTWWIVLIISWFLVGFTFAANPTPWPNYTFLESSVDDWEIRWGGLTKYNTEWEQAISVWNSLWAVDILPDTINTIQDLHVKDVYLTSVGWAWYMDMPSVWSDQLSLNKYYMDGNNSAVWTFTSANKQHTISHELGHALWLRHHNFSSNMLQSGKKTRITVWSQDMSSYQTKW